MWLLLFWILVGLVWAFFKVTTPQQRSNWLWRGAATLVVAAVLTALVH